MEELEVDCAHHTLVRQLQLGVLTRLRCVDHLFEGVGSEAVVNNAH